MQPMEQRVLDLEKRVNRLTKTASVLAFLLVVVVTAAASRHQDATVVRAQRFEVVNNGKIMGIFEATPVGGRLRVLNKNSTMTTEIGQDVEDQGTFNVYRQGRKQPAVLLDAEGLSLWRDKHSYLSITTDKNGGGLTISNKDRRDICVIKADEQGNGEVAVFDSKGQGAKLTPHR